MSRTGAKLPPEFDPDPTDQLPALSQQSAETSPAAVDPVVAAAMGAAVPKNAEPARAEVVESAAAAAPVQAPDERDARIASLEAQLEEQAAAQARLQKELEKAKAKPKRRRRSGGKDAKQEDLLEELERERADLAAQSDERQAAIDRLEKELDAAQAAAQQLQRQLEALGAELDDRARTLVAAREELKKSAARITQLEAELQKAATRPAEKQGRAPVRRSRMTHGEDDETGPVPMVQRDHVHAVADTPAPNAVKMRRFLVRLDPGHEALYELSSATTKIGRTPENDLQVCESFISRLHAVIRVAADSTVLEDAGSSNGVFVNGRRVFRQLLRDGDTVLLGMARFRFEARPQADA
jgi:chromosome segregation ATPase